MTSSKNDGGLGLHKLNIMNKACISKHGWKLKNSNGGIWCDVVWGKYDRNSDRRNISIRPSYSSLWKNIVKVWPKIYRNYIWSVRNGKDVDAWNDRLLTNSRKHKMGLGSVMCLFCNNVEEDTLYVLRDCPRAVALWMTTININKRFNFFAGNLKDWISTNMNCNLGWNADKDWTDFWATACHNIWTCHNKETSDESFNRLSCMITHINNLVQDYEHAKNAANMSLTPHRVLSFIKCEAPPVG